MKRDQSNNSTLQFIASHRMGATTRRSGYAILGKVARDIVERTAFPDVPPRHGPQEYPPTLPPRHHSTRARTPLAGCRRRRPGAGGRRGRPVLAARRLRPPDPGPHHLRVDRHAARRSPARLRVRQGADAGHRRAGRRRRPLRARVCARPTDAAVARVDPVRAPAVPDRRARQRRLRGREGRPPAAGDAARPRLRDRRRRLVVRPAGRDGHRSRLRLLRQQDAGSGAGPADRPDRAPRPGFAEDRRAVDERAALAALLPLLPHLRAAPALRSAGEVQAVRAVRRRDRLLGRDCREPLRLAEGARLVRLRHHRAVLRPRRGPRRPWRAGARPVPVRLDHPGSARHQAAGRAAGGRARLDARGGDRPGAHGARPDRRPPRGGHARPVAPRAARRDREDPAPGRLLRRGPLRALSLRLERAVRAHRRALPVHQGAASRAVRPRPRPRRADQPGRRSPADGGGDARRARPDPLGRDRVGAGRRLGRGARAPPGARLHRRGDRRRAGDAGRVAARPQGQGRRARAAPPGGRVRGPPRVPTSPSPSCRTSCATTRT